MASQRKVGLKFGNPPPASTTLRATGPGRGDGSASAIQDPGDVCGPPSNVGAGGVSQAAHSGCNTMCSSGAGGLGLHDSRVITPAMPLF